MKARSLALAAALALALPAPARAQAEDPAALERARASFAEGVRLYDAKQYEPALAQFRAAYKDRPSPGIKRNMALCLRGLGKSAEAVSLLEEMLAETRDAKEPLKPEVRAAAEQAIAEMLPTVGSARLLIVVRQSPAATAPPAIAVTVDGEPRTRKDDVVRLAPGEHAITARAEGYYQASQKVAVKAGDRDVPVRLEIAATDAYGHATVRASRPDAQISIDGVVVGTGTYAGFVAVGRHHLQVDAPGAPPNVRWLDVYQNRTERIGVELDPPRDKPPEYDAAQGRPPPPAPPPGPERNWYVTASGGYNAQRLTPTAALGGAGAKETYGGFVFAARGGRRFYKGWSAELHAEVGSLSARRSSTTAASAAETSFTQWVVAPGVRFRTAGSVRFYMTGHLGFEMTHLSGSYGFVGPTSVVTVQRSDSAPSWVAMFELGMQVELGKGGAILELGAFGEGHDARGLKESRTQQPFFTDSTAVRYGGRAAFGWEL